MLATGEKKRILVVDDETSIRESLRLILSREYDVVTAENGENALEILRTGCTQAEQEKTPDLVLLDLVMPGLSGIELLKTLTTEHPGLPVVMLTASKAVNTAVQAMKVGAVDYLNKPYDVDELLNLIEITLSETVLDSSNGYDINATRKVSRQGLSDLEGDFGKIVGQHPRMQEIYKKVEQLARHDTTVLINGDSGTGKELIAREIHQRSERSEGPFVALNCAAIPETLIESELFGHEKGAFTHAVEKRIGHFELADNGTLFLDEIGELSLPVQVKMLRFLQEQEFYRVGRSKPINVNVRIVAATNKNLEIAIKEKRFREDLFYRINVVTLELPRLQDRIEDVDNLIQFFIKRLSPIYGGRSPRITEEALRALRSYSWPGNVRELENVTESILALSLADEIGFAELPIKIRNSAGYGDVENNRVAIPFEDATRAHETELIERALKSTSYVQSRAAEMLGISRRILKYKMDKLGISDKPVEESNNGTVEKQ